MKVSEVMTRDVIPIAPEESAEVAARTLTHYNIGVLPVCSADGRLRGVVTDRDLVVRCMAASRPASQVRVSQVMTGKLYTVSPDAELATAAALMASKQLRRLPVVEDGKLCGMVSLRDLAREKDCENTVSDAFSRIFSNIRREKNQV